MTVLRSLLIGITLFIAGCSAQRGTVLLVPIGDVPAELLAHLRQELQSRLERDVAIARPIPIPHTAFDASRHQYLGNALLEDLGKYDHRTAERVVGVIDADLYAAGLNFTFGQARKPGRFAVIALPRLRTNEPARFRERVVKLTIHELGHSLGLAHCENSSCVMRFANTLGDLDRQGASFCTRDRLRWTSSWLRHHIITATSVP